jgi:hypothetical protein
MNDLYFSSCFTAETTFAVKTQQLKQNETAAASQFIWAFPAGRSGPRFPLILHEALATKAGIRCNR